MRITLLILLFSISAFGQQDFVIASIQQASGGVTNIYSTANAASPTNEANATTGLTGSLTTITSVGSPKTNGSYSLQITASGATVVYIARPSTLIAGRTYSVSADISYSGAETGNQFYSSASDEMTAQASTIDLLNGTFKTYTLSAITLSSIADAQSGGLRFYFNSAGTIYIDNIVWTED